jgi:hypothetical protein
VARSCDEPGFATVGFLMTAALSLVLLTTLADLLVQQYAVGAIRAALDEGVRTGTVVTGSASSCRARANAALEGLLGGRAKRRVRSTCTRGSTATTAHARGRVEAWAPLVPDLRVDLRATAVSEEG